MKIKSTLVFSGGLEEACSILLLPCPWLQVWCSAGRGAHGLIPADKWLLAQLLLPILRCDHLLDTQCITHLNACSWRCLRVGVVLPAMLITGWFISSNSSASVLVRVAAAEGSIAPPAMGGGGGRRWQ